MGQFTVTSSPLIIATPTPMPTPICDFTEQQILKGAIPQIGDDFGKSVSICGNWSAVSSDDQIYVFNRLNSTHWQFFTAFSVNTTFGELSVEIFNDIIVATSSQAAFVYQFTGGSWMFVKQLFSGSTDFRRCTAVSNDWIVTCSPFTTVQNTNDGECSIYGRDIGGANNWGFLQTLTASSSSNRRMGTACDIDQSINSILVTADISPTLVGYIFEFDGLEWKLEHSLDGPFTPDDLVSASISNDTAVIGDIFDAGYFPYLLIGTVYIFERNVSNDWEFKQFLSAQDEFFGAHVDLNGDSALAVSSPARSSTPSTVYIYVRLASIGNNWTEANMLEVGDSGVVLPDSTDLSFDGNTLFVGTENSSVGIVNVFTTSNLFCIAQTECTNIIAVSTATAISTPIVTPTSTSVSIPTSTLTATQLASPTSTPTTATTPTNILTPIQTPTFVPTASATPMPECPGDGQCKIGLFDPLCMKCNLENAVDGTSCTAMPDGVCVLGHCLNQTALDAKLKLDQAEIAYAQSMMSVFGGFLGNGSFIRDPGPFLDCTPDRLFSIFINVAEPQNASCPFLNGGQLIQAWFDIAEEFMNSSHIEFTRTFNFEKSLNDACCALAIYDQIVNTCSPDQRWDLENSTVIRNGDYIGFNYFSFEDCHPDHDINDLVLRIRTATLVSDIVDGIPIGRPTVRSTAVHAYPKARGAGFMHQFLVSLDGILDNPNGTLEHRPPVLTECDSEFEQTMKPITINTTNYLKSGDIYSSVLRHIFTFRLPLDASIQQCVLSADADSEQPIPDSLPATCSNNSVGKDILLIPNDFQVLPDVGGSLYTNTFNGSALVEPTYTFSSLIQYANSSTLPVNYTLLTGTFLRFYLRNTDCNTTIDLVEIDPCFLDETFRPWGITIKTPNLWRWPLEGIPVELGDKTGQCVGGDRGGLECAPGPLNCPQGFCLLSKQECRESTNAGAFCNITSECPFGDECFSEMGAYPQFDEHYECFKQQGRCCDVAVNWFDFPLHRDCRDVWCLCDPPFEAVPTPSPTPLMLLNEQGFHLQGYCKLIGQPCKSSLECCIPMSCQQGACL